MLFLEGNQNFMAFMPNLNYTRLANIALPGEFGSPVG
jgi:hypothetical protein